jgi:hypothetical protein
MAESTFQTRPSISPSSPGAPRESDVLDCPGKALCSPNFAEPCMALALAESAEAFKQAERRETLPKFWFLNPILGP